MTASPDGQEITCPIFFAHFSGIAPDILILLQ
jgi:hypothetical protein